VFGPFCLQIRSLSDMTSVFVAGTSAQLVAVIIVVAELLWWG
jgi:hypothetical protein